MKRKGSSEVIPNNHRASKSKFTPKKNPGSTLNPEVEEESKG
jgi:hypothetical protein